MISYSLYRAESHDTHPTWKSTFGPMQKKQSIIRKANTIGMLLMNLYDAARHVRVSIVTESTSTYRLRNHGRDATESCTSTCWKWS